MFHVTEFDCGTEVVWLRPLKFAEKKLCFVLCAKTFEPDYRQNNKKKKKFNELKISMRTYIVLLS